MIMYLVLSVSLSCRFGPTATILLIIVAFAWACYGVLIVYNMLRYREIALFYSTALKIPTSVSSCLVLVLTCVL